MTVKVELPTPRQPYLESGLLPADFYAYEELLSEPEREKILNGSGHRPIRALQGNLTGIAYVEVPNGGGHERHAQQRRRARPPTSRRHRFGIGGLTVEPGQATGHRRCLTIRRSWCGKAAFAFQLRHRGSRGFRRCRQPCLQAGGPQRPAEEVRSSPRLTKP